MPKDVSSSPSSSEDEAEKGSESTETRTTNRKTTRYGCPQDFVSFRHVSCSSMLPDNLSDGESELWLIKAPCGFNPTCFRGLRVPLSGLQTLRAPSAAEAGASQQVYSVLASSCCSPELRLLTSDGRASGGAAFAPSFSGLLNVCESYGDGGTNRAPQVVPATPAPSVPPGLKQRFHPFGSKTPTLTYVAESEADGAAFGPSSTTLRPLVVKRFLEEVVHEVEDDDDDGRSKRKKKKKKEKRVKSEQVEEILKVKQEPVDVFLEEKSRKKKKKKKDREVEEGQECSVKVEPVSVKPEPEDGGYGDAAEFHPKKKKKKKHRTDED